MTTWPLRIETRTQQLEADAAAALYWPGKRSEVYIPEPEVVPLVSAAGARSDAPQATHFFGDNLASLAHLLNSERRFRVIYLDPPFDSAQVYRNKVRARSAAGRPAFERVEYRDRWKLGDYLQFMRDRLAVLRELLTDDGTLYLHCDTRRSHHLRLLCDEVFGPSNFRNEIVWCYTGPSNTGSDFPRKHDVILRYTRSGTYLFNKDAIRVPYRKLKTGATKGIFQQAATLSADGKVPEDWWADVTTVGRLYKSEDLIYPTQKPLQLLERIITASSDPGDSVLDPFSGSASTVVAALRSGRHAVGCDDNPGALLASLRRVAQLNASSYAAYHTVPRDPSPDPDRESCTPPPESGLRVLHSPAGVRTESPAFNLQKPDRESCNSDSSGNARALAERTPRVLQVRPGERAAQTSAQNDGRLHCELREGLLRIENLILPTLWDALQLEEGASWKELCAALLLFGEDEDGVPALRAASVPAHRAYVETELRWDRLRAHPIALLVIDVANDAHVFPLTHS